MKSATAAIRFLERLEVPEGPLAGRPLKLAPFQRTFVKGALADGVNVAALSIGRGNGKTGLSAGLALGALLGEWDHQPRREILIAARTADQGRIAWQFACGFARSLPDDVQRQLTFRRSPRLEIEFDGDGGGHLLKVIAADGKSALGSAPTLVLMDERGHWMADQGDSLEHALLSGLGKRGGRALIISTSAPDDTHPFSRWLDESQPGVFAQEHRPAPGLPADDAPLSWSPTPARSMASAPRSNGSRHRLGELSAAAVRASPPSGFTTGMSACPARRATCC